MTDKISNTLDFVPRIIVTEPSPLPVVNAGLVQNILPTAVEVEAAGSAPSATATAKPAADFIVDSIGETTDDDVETTISPSGSDIDSCTVSLENGERTRVLASQDTGEEEENDGDREDAEESEEEEGDLRMEDGRSSDACWRWLNGFSESKFMFPILLVLLVMPLSAGFMGARYMDRCPLSSSAPLFLFMLGVLGTLVILCRTLVIARKMCGAVSDGPRVLSTIVVFGNLAILLLLCTEMTAFLRHSPSFEPGTANYCHRIFYNFTYWLNYTSIFVVVFLAVIHAPSFSRRETPTENTA